MDEWKLTQSMCGFPRSVRRKSLHWTIQAQCLLSALTISIYPSHQHQCAFSSPALILIPLYYTPQVVESERHLWFWKHDRRLEHSKLRCKDFSEHIDLLRTNKA
eukprot:4098219-Amphidinium_carterae.3